MGKHNRPLGRGRDDFDTSCLKGKKVEELRPTRSNVPYAIIGVMAAIAFLGVIIGV